MKRNESDGRKRGVKLYACALLVLLTGGGSMAVHAQHDQHRGHDMSNMPGMAKPTPTPAATTPAPTPTPTLTPTTTTTTTPDTNTTPLQTPAPAAVTPPAPAPAADSAPAPVDHSMHMGHMGHDAAQPDTAADAHMTHVVESDVNELMVMAGPDMGVRVGTSRTNVVPMGQMASGTAWQPASSPLYMYHKLAGDWLLMFHFEAKTGVNHQGGPRGVTKAESMNWFMPMAYRRIGAGTLQLRGMFSFEPFTFPPGGSPLLFQTGESYKGEPLVDKQHPHDLVMELSAQYTVPVGEHATWFGYFGYPGEPALGPVAFMHRMSAAENPSAPLAHHLQDSTHISFGVLTSGFTYRWLKLEGSLFNGREPDENRYNFEAHPWNARSARLTIAPNRNWAVQVSHGFLRNPETLEPGDTRRTTASVQYNRAFARGNFAGALIWGRNHESHDGDLFNLNSYLGEATLNFSARNYLYTRLELVDKRDLLRRADLQQLGFAADAHPTFRIGAYTLGYVRDVWAKDKLSVGVGGDMTLYSKPATLDQIYGQHPASYKFFFRIRPARLNANDHAGHTRPALPHGQP